MVNSLNSISENMPSLSSQPTNSTTSLEIKNEAVSNAPPTNDFKHDPETLLFTKKTLEKPIEKIVEHFLSEGNVNNSNNLILKKLSKKWVQNAAKNIFDDAFRSILELVVNGHDANNADCAIGKFGLGFFSSLSFLDFEDTDGAEIVITTTYQASENKGLYSYQLILSKCEESIHAKFKYLPPQNTTGTKISIRPTNPFSEDMLQRFFHYLCYLQFYPNGETLINLNGNTYSIGEKHSDRAAVKVVLGNSEINIIDYGCGISLTTAESKLLVPSSSTKANKTQKQNYKIISPQFTTYYGKKNINESMIIVTVGGVVVVKIPSSLPFIDNDGNITDLHLTDFPLTITHITSARNDIKFDEKKSTFEYQYLEKVIEKTLYNIDNDNTSLIYATYHALKSWEAWTANRSICNYFSQHLKIKLQELIESNNTLIPVYPEYVKFFQKIIPCENLVPLDSELVNHQYSRLENIIIQNYQEEIHLKYTNAEKKILEEALNFEAIIGMRVFVIDDSKCTTTPKNKIPIIETLGLPNALFVPRSFFDYTLKKCNSSEPEMILYFFAKHISENYSSLKATVIPKYSSLLDNKNNLAFYSASPKIIAVEAKDRNQDLSYDKTSLYYPKGNFSACEIGTHLLGALSDEYIRYLYHTHLQLILDWSTFTGYAKDVNLLIPEIIQSLNDSYYKFISSEKLSIVFIDEKSEQIYTVQKKILTNALDKLAASHKSIDPKNIPIQLLKKEIDQLCQKKENQTFFSQTPLKNNTINHWKANFFVNFETGKVFYLKKQQATKILQELKEGETNSSLLNLKQKIESISTKEGNIELLYKYQDECKEVYADLGENNSQYYVDLTTKEIFFVEKKILAEITEHLTTLYTSSELNNIPLKKLKEIVCDFVATKGSTQLLYKPLSPKEVLGKHLYSLLCSLIFPTASSTNKIVIDNRVIFPLPENPSISDFERLIFTLMSHTLKRNSNIDPKALLKYGDYSNHISEAVMAGKQAYVMKMKINNFEELYQPLNGYNISSIMMKSKYIISIYPYFKYDFINTLLAPLRLMSCLNKSKILSEKNKQALFELQNKTLELYQQYFIFHSNEFGHNYGSSESKIDISKFKEGYNSQDHHTSNVSLALEILSNTPELFDKFLDFQFQAMKYQCDVNKRREDQKMGKLCYLPHIQINTPFGIGRYIKFDPTKRPQKVTKFPIDIIVKHARNVEEFMFIGYLFGNYSRGITTLYYKAYKNEISKSPEELNELLELFIIHYIHEKVDSALIKKIYSENRNMLDLRDREEKVIDTGTPKILLTFLNESISLTNSTLTTNSFISTFEKELIDKGHSCSLSQWMKFLFKQPEGAKSLSTDKLSVNISAASQEINCLNIGKIEQAVHGSERSALESCAIELIQNSIDAINHFTDTSQMDSIEEKRVLERIEYSYTVTPSVIDPNNAHPTLHLRDFIGIKDLQTLMTDLIIPDFTHKGDDNTNSVGKLGNGMAQIYQNAQKVVIKTRLIDDPNKIYLLQVTPIRNANKSNVKELQLRVAEMTSNNDPNFWGTEIRILSCKLPYNKARLAVLFGRQYLKDTSMTVTATTSKGNRIYVSEKDCHSQVEPKQLFTLNDGNSSTNYKFLKLSSSLTSSMVTYGGVPFIGLKQFLLQIGITNTELLKKLSQGYILNLPMDSYEPVQSRTKVRLKKGTYDKILFTLLNGYYIAELERSKDHPKILEQMFFHFGSTYGSDFSQLVIDSTDPLEVDLTNSDFPEIIFFCFFKPKFLENLSYKNFVEWIDFGYSTLVVSLEKLKKQNITSLVQWVEQTKTSLLNIEDIQTKKVALRKEYNDKISHFKNQAQEILKNWKIDLLQNIQGKNEKATDFIKRIIIPWFEKKVRNTSLYIDSHKVLLEFIPELENEYEKGIREINEHTITRIIQSIEINDTDKKNLIAFINEGMNQYCIHYLKLLNHHKHSTISFNVFYKNSESLLTYSFTNNSISINLKKYSLAQIALLLIEIVQGESYQDTEIFNKLIRVKPDCPGYLNHELEHAISSVTRMHNPGYNADGKLVSFDACAASRAERAIQNGILMAWQADIKVLFTKYCSSKKPNEWRKQLFECDKFFNISTLDFAKYFDIPIKY